MALDKTGLGILGGSFDPVHLGHTQSAQSVATELGLSQILLIPTYISPLKVTPDLLPHANTKQRTAMLEIACNQNSLFSCDTREIKRTGRSYTVETLKELKKDYPNNILHFIIGMDSLITFTQWHQYQEILSLCHLVVNTRPNYPIELINTETIALLKQHQTTDKTQLSCLEAGKIFLANPVDYNISSTQIRQHIAHKKNCEKLLLPEISDFIDKNKLYR